MNYTFEYIFIPQIVAKNADDFWEEGVDLFDNFDDLQVTFELSCDSKERFDWDNLEITKCMTSKLSYWLFKFPTPKEPIDAVWGIIVHRQGKKPVYFTLENGPEGKYFLCSVDRKKHINYGFVDTADRETFIRLALEAEKGRKAELIVEREKLV